MNTNFLFLNLVKPIEIVKGSSLSSVVGSTSRFLTLQIEKPSSSFHNEQNLPLNNRKSIEVLYRPASSSVSHRRSNTVPSRNRKSNSTKTSNQQTPHLSPTYKRNENIQQQT
jgi:hypothetical protein